MIHQSADQLRPFQNFFLNFPEEQKLTTTRDGMSTFYFTVKKKQWSKLTNTTGLHSGSKLLQTLIDDFIFEKKKQIEEDVATVHVLTQGNYQTLADPKRQRNLGRSRSHNKNIPPFRKYNKNACIIRNITVIRNEIYILYD